MKQLYIFCIIHITGLFRTLLLEQNFEYLDDYKEEDYLKGIEGVKLVGAKATTVHEYSYIGAIIMIYRPKKNRRLKPQCTATMITKEYAVTAAHCVYFPTEISMSNCTKGIVQVDSSRPLRFSYPRKPSQDRMQTISCEKLKGGGWKVWIHDPPYAVIFGALDVNTIDFLNNYTMKSVMVKYVDYFILPEGAYDNVDKKWRKNVKKQKERGYDIALLKFKPLIEGDGNLKILPACLPGSSFQDIAKSHILGYGKYFRHLCLTGSQSPMKYHFCNHGGEYRTNACINFGIMKNCKVKFFDGIKERVGCEKEDQTPARFSRLCSKFMGETNFKFDIDIDEVHLLSFPADGDNGTFLETCYRSDPGEFGWCRTININYGHFISEGMIRDKLFYEGGFAHHGKTKITTDFGWGFCSKDCEQDQSLTGEGILREVENVDVLNEKYCDTHLYKTENYTIGKTKLLCVGYNETFKAKIYITRGDHKKDATHWVEAKPSFLKKYPQILQNIYNRWSNYWIDGHYVRSAGTCKGDSGGPLLQKISGYHHVLTGVVSGGNGYKGQCGGINQPTRYTRMKYFTSWIMDSLEENEKKELCIK